MRYVVPVMLAAVLLGFSALAEESRDEVMGVYQGSFTTPDWAGKTIEAKVVAQSKFAWKAVLYVGDGNGAPARVEVKGKGRADHANFHGAVNLGAALGGEYDVEGKIAAKKFEGTFTRDGAAVAAFSLAYTVVTPPSLNMAPPVGAKVLFDGTNADQWVRAPEKWCLVEEEAMEVCGSSLMTREEFGAAQYHIEFRTPFMPEEREQGRGNSGVYLLGRYEVQVLDSFGEEPKWDYCGGIYKIAVPLTNASLPPLQWQTYDITFQPAQFDAAGAKTANAHITVVLNGVTIHDNLELPDRTPGGLDGGEAPRGPLYLQDHGNQVRYRNIWVKPLE